MQISQAEWYEDTWMTSKLSQPFYENSNDQDKMVSLNIGEYTRNPKKELVITSKHIFKKKEGEYILSPEKELVIIDKYIHNSKKKLAIKVILKNEFERNNLKLFLIQKGFQFKEFKAINSLTILIPVERPDGVDILFDEINSNFERIEPESIFLDMKSKANSLLEEIANSPKQAQRFGTHRFLMDRDDVPEFIGMY
jgi:hypothetical protein